MKAFKFRLKTNSASSVLLASIAGSNRFVWNKALALQKERLENKEYTLSYYKMADSFRYPQGIKVSDNRVFLPKIGWV